MSPVPATKLPVRIIHLEDNLQDRELVAAMLSAAEIQCEITHAEDHDSFERALANVEANLIISDFTMPGYTGVRALQLAQKLCESVPFIFFSGTIGEDAAIQSLKNGATDYVLKQYPDRLVAAVRRALIEASERAARRHAEEELRRRDVLLRQIMENVEDLILVVDFNGRSMLSSPSYQRLFRRQQQETGTDFLSEIHPEDRDAVRNIFQETLSRGIGQRVEYRLALPSGNIRYMEAQGSVIRQNRHDRYVLWVVHDITERKLAEEKILEQAALLDEAHDAICVNDLDQNILFWNKGAERLYGWNSYEAVGRNANDLLFQNIVALKAVKTLIQRGEWHGELQQVTKSGVRLTVESRWTLICEPNGTPKSILVINTDITQRKLAEEKILEQAALLDKAQDAIFVSDLEEKILYWNAGATRLYGWSSDEALYNPIKYPINHLLFENVYDSTDVHAALFEKGEWFGELRQLTKSGKNIIVQSRQTLIRNKNGDPTSILFINSDITEKKQIENQFLRTQRMENLGALAGGMAHDLNNILAPILMAVEMIQTDPQSDANGKLLETIASSAIRGSELVKQILSFARGMGGEKTLVHIRHIVSDVVKLMGTSFSRKITVHAEVPQDLPSIHGDATQLHQVLLNLCVNARDAMMPAGGSLTIKAESVQLEAKATPLMQAPVSGAFIVLQVSDTGTGMPPEVMAKIFEPFFTTKEAGKGTGLGLSTVMSIVKSHGGLVEVTSQPGTGTTFQVYFPVARETPAARKSLAKPEQGRGEQILVVDDEIAIIEITCTTLNAYNYRALTASDGLEALEVFSRLHAEIDLVVTDMMMPGMDGMTLVNALREIDPNVQVIAVSGFITHEKLEDFKRNGVKYFLKKPFSAEKLLSSVRLALEG